jgi:hypothetical protein
MLAAEHELASPAPKALADVPFVAHFQRRRSIGDVSPTAGAYSWPGK